jgi:hypothetical protein
MILTKDTNRLEERISARLEVEAVLEAYIRRRWRAKGESSMEGKHGRGERVIYSVDEDLLYIYGELE